MSLDKEHSHTAGALKQTNKTHKHGRHRSKGSISIASKGKINIKTTTRKNKAELTRDQRRNQTVQLRKNKRAATLDKMRSVCGNAPITICVLPLNQQIDRNTALTIITQCDPEAAVSTNETCMAVDMPRFKKRFTIVSPSLDNDFEIMDAIKVADVTLLIVSAVGGIDFGSDIVDDFGKKLLQYGQAQGLPTTVIAVTDLESIAQKKRNEHKQTIQKLISKWLPDEKIQPLDSNADALNLMRHIFNKKRKVIKSREIRPYLFSEKFVYTPDSTGCLGTLVVTGYLKGCPLSANRLVYIPGLGTHQVSQISMQLETPQEGDSRLLQTADPEKQESLDSENIPNPLDAEQTWPTEEELKMAEDANKARKVKKVPKGWSDYQAAWIPDEDAVDQSASSSDSDSDDAFMDARSEEASDAEGSAPDQQQQDFDTMTVSEVAVNDQQYDDQTDMVGERADLEKLQAAKSDQMYPDEMDTPFDMLAQERFRKYRGLESFRTSPWDPKEDLPSDYARIFQFANFDRTKKRVLSNQMYEQNIAQPGMCINVHIVGVSQQLWDSYRSANTRVYVTGLLPHENKMSVQNVVLHRTQNYDAPIKSKERLIFQCGYRRFIVNPVFSQHTNGKKHKFERYFQPDSTIAATFFAPIQFPPAPVLCYKEINNKLVLVATGSLLSCNPDRIVLKRSVLSGHPLKVHKRSAVIRFMFFNRDDIVYFKPCKLRTKHGRIGHIKEPLGTHGHMKCVFDGQLKSQDTILLHLYKRVFPKWTYEECLVTCGESDDNMQGSHEIKPTTTETMDM